MKSVLLIFIDGLGIGKQDPGVNPLAAFNPRVLRLYQEVVGPFPRRGVCRVTDARLGVPGLPQSATGQTTIMTGVNAAAYLGHHFQGFPNQALKQLIHQSSLFQRLKRKGLKVTFANTYTPDFQKRRRRRPSVTSVMCQSAEVNFWQLSELMQGRSLFMDFTNRMLHQRGYDVPHRTPGEAAGILLRLARDYHCCLYEYFLTDLVGHRGSFQEALDLLQQLDAFLFEIVARCDLKETSVVVTSDHGNIEQMDRKQHTFNPVPTLFWGPIQEEIPDGENFSLTDIAPLIESFLTPEIQ